MIQKKVSSLKTRREFGSQNNNILNVFSQQKPGQESQAKEPPKKSKNSKPEEASNQSSWMSEISPSELKVNIHQLRNVAYTIFRFVEFDGVLWASSRWKEVYG
jgi:hypothetical protein